MKQIFNIPEWHSPHEAEDFVHRLRKFMTFLDESASYDINVWVRYEKRDDIKEYRSPLFIPAPFDGLDLILHDEETADLIRESIKVVFDVSEVKRYGDKTFITIRAPVRPVEFDLFTDEEIEMLKQIFKLEGVIFKSRWRGSLIYENTKKLGEEYRTELFSSYRPKDANPNRNHFVVFYEDVVEKLRKHGFPLVHEDSFCVVYPRGYATST